MNSTRLILAGLVAVLLSADAISQERVVPKNAKGGKETQGEPWAEVPDTFKIMKIPDWPVPTDRKRWEETDCAKTRATLLR